MLRIVDDLTRAVCPSFEDPGWEFLRTSMVNAHQGDQPLTPEEAAQQMKDAWVHENQHKVDAWNEQQWQDLKDQGEQDRIAHEAEDMQWAQQEAEAEELRKEAERKKPRLNPIDPELHIAKWIELRPSSYSQCLVMSYVIDRLADA